MGEASQLEVEEFKELAYRVVNYILAEDYTKYPVKKYDITKNVLAAQHSSQSNAIIQEAKTILSNVFGMDLVEMEHSSTKQYIVVNRLGNCGNLLWTEDVSTHQTLLMLVLGIIYMNGYPIKEDILWNYLTTLKITQDEHGSISNIFGGDVRKIISQEFVRQMYLESKRISEENPPQFEYSWGLRADREVSKRGLLNFIGKVYGNNDVVTWGMQYNDMLEQEKSMNEPIPREGARARRVERAASRARQEERATQRVGKEERATQRVGKGERATQRVGKEERASQRVKRNSASTSGTSTRRDAGNVRSQPLMPTLSSQSQPCSRPRI